MNDLLRRRDLKNWHITQTNVDSDGSSTSGNEEVAHQSSAHIGIWNRSRLRFVEVIPLALIVAVPLSVHAGVLSTLVNAWNPGSETMFTDYVVQPSDVKILTAYNTADQKAAIGGGDVIVNEGALVPGGLSGDDLLAEDIYNSGEISLYVVREGDTLSQIAEMFSVTSNTILWANDLTSATAIQPGDTLVILPIVGVQHIVKDGDTISTIAKKYDGDAEEILSYNQLASADELRVGNTIVIPGGNMQAPTKSRPSVTPTSVTGSAAASSNMVHPLPGAVRTQGIHGYNAVDLAAGYGTPVRAAASGEVIISKSSGWNGGYGNYIVVRHGNGSQTLYAHLSSNAVGIGAFVGGGETIGYVGNSGRSTGAHLHFEVRGARNPF